nr:DUF4125 family protein [Desulfuromonas sp. TF]
MGKESIINYILDIEWEMSISLTTRNVWACHSDPFKFRTIRSCILKVWTYEMLENYLSHIKSAKNNGRNLITEKYDRIDNCIPYITQNPLIIDIVAISVYWHRELQVKYPILSKLCCPYVNAAVDGGKLWIFLRSELETYGERTVELYFKHAMSAYLNKKNLTSELLLNLTQKIGLKNLEQAESYLREKQLKNI